MQFLDLGDTAFTVEFGDAIDPALQAAVLGLDAAIARERAAGRLAGLIETVPTFRSLTLVYDPLVVRRAALEAEVRALLDAAGDAPPVAGRRWRLPACYGGPDLEAVAGAAGLAPAEAAALHAATDYLVYMLGFLPGFAFMGELPAALHRPRRAEPRLRVPAGSLAVAASLTAVYPWESPGGWHLIGRCPVPLFDPARETPALLAPGDRVGFEAVGEDECAAIAADLAAGRLDPMRWCEL